MVSINCMVRNYTATIGRIDIVSSTSEDAKYLQENLRPDDVRECIIHGVSPNRALHMPLVDKGCKTFTALVDDIPICMFGTMQYSNNSSFASIWLLGSKDIEKNYFSFLKASKEIIELLQNDYEVLENVVPSDHKRTITWLAWLGFSFYSVPVYVNSFECLRFVRCQEGLEMPMLNS